MLCQPVQLYQGEESLKLRLFLVAKRYGSHFEKITLKDVVSLCLF